MKSWQNPAEMKFCDPETIHEMTAFDYSVFDEPDYDDGREDEP